MTIAYDLTESQWRKSSLPKITGPAHSWARILYFNVHFVGSVGSLASRNEVDLMNQLHEGFLARLPTGYSFGYSSAVGLSGRSYEGRGDRYRAASNGMDTEHGEDDIVGNPRIADNLEIFSCVLLIGQADIPNQRMIDGVNKLYTQMPKGVFVNGHRDMDQTGCPGEWAYKMTRDGTFHRIVGSNKVIDKFTLLDPPDRFYDSRVYDDDKPQGPGMATYGVKKYDGINFPTAVEVTVTVIPQNVAEGDGFLGVNSSDSFINWKQSEIGKAIPATVWLPVNERGEISLYSQDTVHILLSVRAYA